MDSDSAPETPTKVCTKCNTPKLISAYHKQHGGLYGVRSICKDCVSTYSRRRHVATYQPHERTKATHCRMCSNPRTTKSTLCRSCLNTSIRERYARNPERRKRRNEWAKQWRDTHSEQWRDIYTRANRKAAEKRKVSHSDT